MNARTSLGLPLWCAAGLLVASCDGDPAGPVAGTNDETHTEIAARVFLPDGRTPAVGASVSLVPRDGVRASATGLVDSTGHPVVSRVPDGVYAVTSSSGPLTSWTDSVAVVAGRLQTSKDDTLQLAGSISGVVLPQPQHDARTITVNVLGTDIWANVGLDGRFTIPELGAGPMRLRFTTTLPDYSPLFATSRLGVSQNLSLLDTLRMPYTGIPVVLGLRAANDSATGDILLSWNAADHPHVADYVVYRDSAGSIGYSSEPIASTAATSWRDTTAKSASRARTWRYRVAVRVSGSSDPGAWYEIAAATSIPPSLAHLNDIAWKSWGAPGGTFPGFLGGFLATASLEVGTDSVRLPLWSSIDGAAWSVSGTSFAPRRMGQTIVRAAGFGAGRIWSFGRSAIGDGVEVSTSRDGKAWTRTTIPDSLWPGDASLSVVGGSRQVALVSAGARSTVLLGDTSGTWTRITVSGRVLGLDDSGIWTDGGAKRLARYDAATGRNVLRDLGTWTGGDPLVAIVPWDGSFLVQAGSRLWHRDGELWSPRSASPVNAMAVEGDTIVVRDTLGAVWLGLP